MRRFALLLACLLVGVGVGAWPAGADGYSPSPDCLRCAPSTIASAEPGSFDVTRAGRSDHVDGRGDPANGYAPGKKSWLVVEESSTPACSGNDRATTDLPCTAAIATCATGEVRFWIWHRTLQYTLGPNGAATSQVAVPWHQEPRTYCLGPDDPGVPTLAKVVAQVQLDFARLPLRRPAVTSYPGPDSLVNFDTAFYAGAATTQLFDPVLLGVPVHVRASPTSWTWTWGDGTTTVTTTPGLPSRPIVVHRYLRVDRMVVAVVVEWTGSFTLGGSNTTYPIAGHAFSTPASTAVEIREARTQLVSR